MQKESDYSANIVMMTKEGYQQVVNTKDGKNLYWTTDQNTELPIKIPSSGKGSLVKPQTIPSYFQKIVQARGDHPALKVQRDNREYVWTWSQYFNDALAFSKSLSAIGVDERKAVNIMGFNAPEWAISMFGSLFHNNIATGVYITNGASACKYQAENSEAQVIVVDTEEQLRQYMGIIDSLPEVKAIITWGVDTIPDEFAKDSRVYTFKNFLQIGKSVKDEESIRLIDKQKPGQCCLLIYTSGTTGNPKGVMLSHDNILFSALILSDDAFNQAPEDMNVVPEESRIISYLPLSHVAGFQFDLIHPLIFGFTTFFAKRDALQGTLVESMQWCRPTSFLAVPRIWEKFEDKLKELAKTKPGFMQSISGWAKGHGYEKVIDQQSGKQPGFMYSVANFLILKRIKQALGLDQTAFFFYGAAPLKQTSVDYFASLDIPLLNMYGLSETTGSTTSSNLTDFSLKHAGEQMGGSHIKIANPDEKGEGEITIQGRHVMMGYLKNEDATKGTFDQGGYFKTGDKGRLDNGGRFLKITGRIKELIIGAGGENVAPVPIEDTFKEECPACSNIMIVGEQRRFMSALITFKVDIDMKTGTPSTNLMPEVIQFFQEKAGVSVKTSDEACSNQKVFECIQKCVAQTNKRLVSKAAHIKKFSLLPVDFSIPGGELTPTMKLKRKVTETKYMDAVEKIYAVEAKM